MRRPVAAALIAFLISAAIGLSLARFAHNREQEAGRLRALETASTQARSLSLLLDRTFSSAWLLGSLEERVASSEETRMLRERLAIELPAVREVSIIDSGEPSRSRIFVEDGRLLVSASTPLGDGSQRYVRATAEVDPILRESGLHEVATAGYDYALSARSDAGRSEITIVRSTELELEDPVTLAVPFAGGDWTLELSPAGGWVDGARPNLLLAVLFSLLFSLTVYEILKKPEILEREVEKRARRLLETNRKLMDEIIERERAEEMVVHEATHDQLTGLENRTAFLERLGRIIDRFGSEGGTPFAVLYLDIDRFTALNDSLGHGAGDRLIVETARRLQRCLRPQDLLARVGGDEFAALLFSVRDPLAIGHIAARVQEAISEPFHIGDDVITTSASLGTSLYMGEDRQAGMLVRDASIAMSRAKAEGGACHVQFDPAMHEWALARLRIENELRVALGRNELRVFYQPIVSLQSGEVSGFEALIRWEHPSRGLLAPGAFVEVAESSGLIIDLDRWVLNQALADIRDLNGQRQTGEPLTVSVNLSGKQFSHPTLLAQVDAALETSGLDPALLRLEITESAMMDDAEAALAALSQLKERAINLSIDDFGTGYSSLAYLRQLPVDVLKIDRSFVMHMDHSEKDAEIVRVIIALAEAIGLDVIAEGIETEQNVTSLRSLGSTYGQGYFFSRPVPLEEARTLIGKVSAS